MSIERLRGIVRRASNATETPFAKAWLRDDPDGKWETRAADLLTRASEHPAFPQMSDSAVDGEIATMLGLMALEAILREGRLDPA